MSKATRDYYDRLAEIYDQASAKYDVNGEFSGQLGRVLHPVSSALDLGCGTGQTIEALRQRFPSVEVLGVDLSESMLAQAKSKFNDVSFHCQEMTAFVSELKATFDLISAISCLEFVPRLPDFIRRLLKHIRKPGTCILTYEPLIARSIAQSKATDTLTGGSVEAVTPFPIYRWEPMEIEEVVTGSGGILAASRLYASYIRDGQPVIYHLLRIGIDA